MKLGLEVSRLFVNGLCSKVEIVTFFLGETGFC